MRGDIPRPPSLPSDQFSYGKPYKRDKEGVGARNNNKIIALVNNWKEHTQTITGRLDKDFKGLNRDAIRDRVHTAHVIVHSSFHSNNTNTGHDKTDD